MPNTYFLVVPSSEYRKQFRAGSLSYRLFANHQFVKDENTIHEKLKNLKFVLQRCKFTTMAQPTVFVEHASSLYLVDDSGVLHVTPDNTLKNPARYFVTNDNGERIEYNLCYK